MVGGGVTFAGGVQEQLQLGLEPRLPDESVKGMRPQFLVADRSSLIAVAETMRRESSETPVLVRPSCMSMLDVMEYHLPLSSDDNASLSTRGTSSALMGVAMDAASHA